MGCRQPWWVCYRHVVNPSASRRRSIYLDGVEREPVPNGDSKRELTRTRSQYREKLKSISLYDYLIYHQREIVFSECSWRGIRALKNPFDAWIYQELIFSVQPGIIVEIGSYAGGGTAFLASMLDILGNGTVVSVDLDASKFQLRHDRVIQIEGDSQSPEVVRRVRDACIGRRTLIIHDGDHRMESVLADLRSYADLVTKGSYFIIEDGIVDLFEPSEFQWSGPGPMRAVEAFLQERDDFVVDDAAERYILTYNPQGFLRRTSAANTAE
jgi:cephalosporin hydroxylase